MRLHRFYVEQPLGEVVVIKDVSLIQQWTRVFRYTVSDFVILFNGDGSDITYSLNSIEKNQCTLIRTKHSLSYIPTKRVTLYLSVIKKDNFELVAQKVTELGVTTIVPIISERSEKKNLNEERLLKIVKEASEQCGRGDIPTVSSVIPLKEVLQNISTQKEDVSFLLQMGGIPLKNIKIGEMIATHSSINLFIGPEGGWSTDEETLFTESLVTPLSLGNTVLRAETAAIVACAFCTL